MLTSVRPVNSGARIRADVAIEIVQIRRAHPDWGKLAISRRLSELHGEPVVSPTGVRSVLRDAGLWYSTPLDIAPTGTGVRYPPALRDRACHALAAGASAAAVGRVYGIDASTIRRWCPAASGSAGRPARIPPEHWPSLRQQVLANPGATLPDHCELWLHDRSTSVSPSVMSRTLRRLGLSPAAGRPSRIPPTLWPHLRAQVENHPDATLQDHCRLWQRIHGISVSDATMLRLFRRLGLTPRGRCASTASGLSADD